MSCLHWGQAGVSRRVGNLRIGSDVAKWLPSSIAAEANYASPSSNQTSAGVIGMCCSLPQVERLSHELFQVRRESGRSDWLQSAHVPARARDARGASPTTSPACPSATR